MDVPSGVERADVLAALVRTFKADSSTLIELSDEALIETAGDDARYARRSAAGVKRSAAFGTSSTS